MTKRWIAVGLAAASLLVGASPAMASRDRLGPGDMGWQWTGGTATAPGVSLDGPKSSNAYNLSNGYVYLRGYWDMPLTAYIAQFAYLADGDVAEPVVEADAARGQDHAGLAGAHQGPAAGLLAAGLGQHVGQGLAQGPGPLQGERRR